METLGWILVIALPAFLLAWWGTGLKKRADLHRRQDAPEVRPYWVPEELFKASIYTAEGNKYRRQAALFLYLYPLLWMVLVFAVANVIGRWL